MITIRNRDVLLNGQVIAYIDGIRLSPGRTHGASGGYGVRSAYKAGVTSYRLTEPETFAYMADAQAWCRVALPFAWDD